MRRLRPLLFVLVVAALVWTYRAFDLSRYTSVGGMRALVDASDPYGPLVFMGVCVLGIFLHMPEIVLIAVGGLIFDGPQAFAYSWIAAMVGATATFLLVRYFARDYFQRTLQRRFARLRALDERLARNGFVTVLALRLLLLLAPPLNWSLGATRVRFQHYVAGTALGIVPGIATTVFFADSIAGHAEGEAGGGKVVMATMLVAAFLIVGAIASRRFLGKPAGAPPA